MQVSNTMPAGEYEYWLSSQTTSGPVIALRTFPQEGTHGEPGATKIAVESDARNMLAATTEAFDPSIVRDFGRERPTVFLLVPSPPD